MILKQVKKKKKLKRNPDTKVELYGYSEKREASMRGIKIT